MTIIYVVGVISGSLFHSVVNPCSPMVGAQGGIYALFGKNSSDSIYDINISHSAMNHYSNITYVTLGAGIIKLKRHKKYFGTKRKTFNLFLCIFILTLVVADLGNSIYFWVICDPSVKNTAISAHVGGLIGGLVTGFIVLNKFQESVGQQRMRLVVNSTYNVRILYLEKRMSIKRLRIMMFVMLPVAISTTPIFAIQTSLNF